MPMMELFFFFPFFHVETQWKHASYVAFRDCVSRPVLFLGKDASSRAEKENRGKKKRKRKKEKASKARRRNEIEGESR